MKILELAPAWLALRNPELARELHAAVDRAKDLSSLTLARQLRGRDGQPRGRDRPPRCRRSASSRRRPTWLKLPPAWKPEPSNALAGGPSASAAGGSCPAGWETWTLEEAVELKLALGYPLAREEFLARARALALALSGASVSLTPRLRPDSLKSLGGTSSASPDDRASFAGRVEVLRDARHSVAHGDAENPRLIVARGKREMLLETSRQLVAQAVARSRLPLEM